MRVFFDTNVLVSSLLFGGVPRRCVALSAEGRIEGVTSSVVLDEVASVLQAKFGLDAVDVVHALSELLVHLDLASAVGDIRPATQDPDDDRVLASALAAGADLIVTGDRRHLLPLASYEGMGIVTPAELLRRCSSS